MLLWFDIARIWLPMPSGPEASSDERTFHALHISIFVACAHGLHIPLGRSIPTVAFACHALVDEDQGLFYRLRRALGAVSF